MNGNVMGVRICAALVGMALCICALSATAAGRVMYAVGEASARGSAGAERALKRGDTVAAGDTLVTRAGRMQVRFEDGALVSLQPKTEFAVENFDYDAQREEGRSFFGLLRGGIRAVTGAIGRADRTRYRVRTPFATIGIRGTTYKARVCAGDCAVPDGLYAKGGEGTIVVFNDEGELELTRGQRGYVQSLTSAPEPTATEPDVADVPTPGAGEDGGDDGEGPVTDTSFVAGQAVFQGSVSGVSQTLPIKQAAGAASGTVTIGGDVESGSFVQADAIAGSDLTVLNGSFNEDGGLIGIAATDSSGDSGAAFVTNVAEPQTDGVLYLGRWTNGTATVFADGGFSESGQLDANDNAHYIVSVDGVHLPAGGSATYMFSGLATSSTGTDGSIGQGIASGQVSVGFGTNLVSTNFDVVHGGTLSVSTVGPLYRPEGDFETSGFASGTGCSPSCAAYADGFVSGSQSTPERVGLGYLIEQANRDIVGVGGFRLAPASP